MKQTTAKLESLREKQAQLQARIDRLEAQAKTQARKDDTRLKILIGAAMLADAELRPQTNEFIRAVLTRGITAERDKEFLAMKDWL